MEGVILVAELVQPFVGARRPIVAVRVRDGNCGQCELALLATAHGGVIRGHDELQQTDDFIRVLRRILFQNSAEVV